MNRAVCNRCDTPVSFDDVSPGYWAVCPKHDEDLFMIECKVEVTQEFDGNRCPKCLDVMDSSVSYLRPTWSDHYDNVVCLDCAEAVYANA